MDPDDVPTVDVDDLTEEQRDLLNERATDAGDLSVEDAAELYDAAETMDTFRELVEAEARRQNEWVETQIWETDWTEVEVLDLVTLEPRAMGVHQPDIHAFRYAHAEAVPNDSHYHREGYRVTLQRLERGTFLSMVEAGEVEIPEDTSLLHGPRGVDDEDDLPNGGGSA